MPDPRLTQFAAERAALARAIHKRVNSSRIGATVPYSVGDAERAAAAAIMEGWTPPGDVTTEHGERMSGGGFQVRSSAAYVERISPLADWIAHQQRLDGVVYRRRVVVVEDWEPLPPAPGCGQSDCKLCAE